MKKKRIAYPRTTASQRKKLFEVWEETRDVGTACREAKVSERTFYNWKPKTVQRKVVELKKAHSKWGRRRIADEIAKENNWVPLVSPSSVKRILEQAELLPESKERKKKDN